MCACRSMYSSVPGSPRAHTAAWFAIVGFAVVIFTYVGIGMLPTADESAHVYTEK